MEFKLPEDLKQAVKTVLYDLDPVSNYSNIKNSQFQHFCLKLAVLLLSFRFAGWSEAGLPLTVFK